MRVQHIRGDTWLRAWEIRTADNQPIDLNGASVRLDLRDENNVERIFSASVNEGLTIQPGQGRVDLRIEAQEMSKLSPGPYRFDLELTTADGIVRTIEQSILYIVEDVTRD